MEFWLKLFDTSDFPARWYCGRWTDGHGWLHIFSDIGIWTAYFAIPGVLLFFSLRRRDLPYRKIFLLFVAFILLCGSTHLMEAIIFWWPAYRFAGVLKFVTAAVSWTTVFALVQVVPGALAMRSPEELEREINARKKAEHNLHRANELLEERVKQRTAELAATNETLHAEREWFSTTLKSIGDAVITTDTEGRVSMLNPVAETLTGWSRGEAHGRPLTEVFRILDEKTREPIDNPALRALHEGRIVALANRTLLVARDDSEILISDSAAPIIDDDNVVTGAVLIFRDVTAQYRAVAELRYQYGLTKAITDNATTAIFMLDEESKCTFMNPAAEALTGFRFSELQGEVLHDFVHQSCPTGAQYEIPACPIERALQKQEELRDHEDTFLRKDGASFSGLCNARRITREGETIGTVLELLDLTAQKQATEELRRSEARFSQLADNISQLAWMADANGSIFWYNERWYEYTGTTLEEMKRSGWQTVHHPDHVERVTNKILRCFQSGETWEDTFPIRSRDGTYRWFLSRALPLHDSNGKIERWFGTHTDITEQRETQDELRRLAAKLSEDDKRKDIFLATLAHELRNPLAPIRTGLEVMSMITDEPAQLEEVRSTMERQTEQLVSLVDDLMDVSRITQGKLELRRQVVELQDVLNVAIEATKPLIDEASHRLAVDAPGSPILVDADPNRLAQVFSNLLSNAAKYTAAGGQIDLSVQCSEHYVTIAVSDNGVGIPQEDLQRIFEMFGQREHPMQRAASGLGIGLTLVKSLTELHDGEVEVQSKGVGQGSTFRVRLPRVRPDSRSVTPAAAADSSPSTTHRCRVLVVDDNLAAAKMLRLVVSKLGHVVRTANDGEQAIEVAENFKPDIVFMDIGMPNLNGYEAARRIRREAWGKNIFLVALSGWGQEDDMRQSREAGFDRHLVKPAEPSRLRDLLDEAAKRS